VGQSDHRTAVEHFYSNSGVCTSALRRLASAAGKFDDRRSDDVPLQVQIADSEPRRIRGLMFQDQLPNDQGMIFVFEQPGLYSLWMLNMQFSLDMIWFDQEGKVVHIEKDVPPCKTPLEITVCQSVIPDEEAVYVLEVTSGFVEQNNITKDSVMRIISI